MSFDHWTPKHFRPRPTPSLKRASVSRYFPALQMTCIVSQNSKEGRQPRHSSCNAADAPSQDPESGDDGRPRERGRGNGGSGHGNSAGVFQSDALCADDAGEGKFLINDVRLSQPILNLSILPVRKDFCFSLLYLFTN